MPESFIPIYNHSESSIYNQNINYFVAQKTGLKISENSNPDSA
jgi:hypothetical protein